MESKSSTEGTRTGIWAAFVNLLVSSGDWPASNAHVSGREVRRYLIAALAAAGLCLAAAVFYLGSRVLMLALVAAVSGTLAEVACARIRRRPPSGGAFIYGLLLALVIPVEVPAWMVAAGAFAGILFGKEAFGGTASHIFMPVMVAKGFLVFSYPKTLTGAYFGNMIEVDSPDAWMICSGVVLAGAVLMAIARPANLRIMAGVLLGGTCVAVALQQAGVLPFETAAEFAAGNGFLVGACLLVCDPASSPRDDEAKWLFGLLIGACAALMRAYSTYAEAMMSAILMGNLFAPLFDAIAAADRSRRSS